MNGLLRPRNWEPACGTERSAASANRPRNWEPACGTERSAASANNMTVLPGVLACSFDRLRTGSPCDVLCKYASAPTPRYRGVARWHTHLHGLATSIHERSGLRGGNGSTERLDLSSSTGLAEAPSPGGRRSVWLFLQGFLAVVSTPQNSKFHSCRTASLGGF
jgi:hypothetical protein